MKPTEPAPNNPSDAAASRDENLARAKVPLNEQEGWLRTVLQNTSDMITVLEADSTIRYVSPAIERILGYRPEQLVGTSAFDYVHPDDIAFLADSFAEALEKPGVLPPIEFRLRTSDGSWRYVETIRSNQLDDPAVRGIVTTTRDVTGRKHREGKRRQGEERLRAQYNGFPIPTFSWRKVQNDFELADYNEAADKITRGGLTGRLGMRASEWYSDNPQIQGMLSRCFREGSTIQDEIPWRMRTTGEDKHFAVTFAYVPPDLVIHHAEDITERKQAEEEVRFQAKLLDTVGQAIIATDPQGKIVYWNLAAENLYGWSSEEMIGRPIVEVTPSEELVERAGQIMSELMAGRSWTGEFVVRRKDGTNFPAMVTDTPVYDERGDLIGIIGASTDITEIKQTEELRRSEERFRLLAENAQDLIFRYQIKPNPGFEYVSPSATTITGYTPEEHYADPELGLKIVHPDDRHLIDEVLRHPESPVIIRWLRKDGNVLWAEQHNKPIYDETGELVVIEGISRDITERVRAVEKLKESERRFSSVVSNAHAYVYRCLNEPGYPNEFASDYALELTGYPPEDLLVSGKVRFGDLILEEDRGRVWEEIQRALAERRGFHLRYTIRRKDGTVRHVQEYGQGIYGEDGEVEALEGLVYDVTESVRVEERLLEAEKRYLTLVERVPAVVYIQEIGSPDSALYMSPQIQNLTGYSPEECEDPDLRWGMVHPDDREQLQSEDQRTGEPGEVFTTEYRVVHRDGRTVWVRNESVLVEDEANGSRYWQGFMLDITERKTLEEELRHRAFHDLLTGLPNRHLFMDRLGQTLRRTRRRPKRKVAVLFVDLDNFKIVNDSLGHELGDELLVAVVERLRGSLRPEDTLARFGGDEFTVLIEDVASPEDVVRMAERIVEDLRAPFIINERELFVRASIGITMGDARTKTPEELLRDADTAMYRAKADAADYRMFDPGMYERTRERLELENDLRRALEKEEFTIYYQPKFRLGQHDRIEGLEALVRWVHPQRGLMLPDDFIPIAEETGLIIPIGRWVMKEACCQAKEWQERYPSERPLSVCVNLSAGQVRHPGLLQDVSSTLRDSGLEAGSLILEITEGTLLKDTELLETIFRELKALGVRLAIDDFGKEYSSLSYLRRLPVDSLKIDGSFVESIGEDPSSTIIVEAIISLAHSLGLEVTGEGVENDEQLERLRRIGCDLAQGYHLARPLPSQEVEPLLAD